MILTVTNSHGQSQQDILYLNLSCTLIILIKLIAIIIIIGK